ncbi:hypothetical protein DFP72DRAFT_1076650 [Ephemerocybe angulata]|uniref:F-box domain-containing protein n=1 Tax=Ephemerocybe angulata TaxID=980116 RepID=A0A8H6HGX1_9AGAR|nr:hypothetical protein DFP72DRAFT_1076650 [Tulosesus angulatus]
MEWPWTFIVSIYSITLTKRQEAPHPPPRGPLPNSPFLELPIEVHHIIGDYLEPSDVLAVIQTSVQNRNAHMYNYLASIGVLSIHNGITRVRLSKAHIPPSAFSLVQQLPAFKTPRWSLACDIFHFINNIAAISMLFVAQPNLTAVALSYRGVEQHLLQSPLFHQALAFLGSQPHHDCRLLKVTPIHTREAVPRNEAVPRRFNSPHNDIDNWSPGALCLGHPEDAIPPIPFFPVLENLVVHMACFRVPPLSRLLRRPLYSQKLSNLSVMGLQVASQAEAAAIDNYLPYSPYLKSLALYADPGFPYPPNQHLCLVPDLFKKVPALKRLDTPPSPEVFGGLTDLLKLQDGQHRPLRVHLNFMKTCSPTSFRFCHETDKVWPCIGGFAQSLHNADGATMVVHLPAAFNIHFKGMASNPRSNCSCFRSIGDISTPIRGISTLVIKHANICVSVVHAIETAVQISRLFSDVGTGAISARGKRSEGLSSPSLLERLPRSVAKFRVGSVVYERRSVGKWAKSS